MVLPTRAVVLNRDCAKSGLWPRKPAGIFCSLATQACNFQSSCMPWALPLPAPWSCQAFRELQTPSNPSGGFPRKWVLHWHKSMIKIFSKCVKENNLLLLSPSGGNCCLGGLSCALRLEAPALSTESALEHLDPCAYGFFPLFPPPLFTSFRQKVPCLLSISSQIKPHLKKKQIQLKKKKDKNPARLKKIIPKSTNHPQLFFFHYLSCSMYWGRFNLMF